MDLVKRNALRKPIVTGIALMLIAMVFRLTDIFVLRLDERLGEIILSKALGFVLVLLFLWLIGRKPASIGLHRRGLGAGVLIAVVITAVPFLVSYAVEMVVLGRMGQEPRLLLAAIDPKAGVAGGVLFAAWLVLGNFVNSFMEEGLFRGVMLNLDRMKLSLWRANGLQALLFGVWHLVWVVKWYQTGTVSTGGEIGMAVVANFLPQLCLGVVWGYAYVRTGSLWTAWTAHTLTNTTLNLLHVAVADGLDPGMSIRMTTFSIVSLVMIFAIRYLAGRFGMSPAAVWGSGDPAGEPLRSGVEADGGREQASA